MSLNERLSDEVLATALFVAAHSEDVLAPDEIAKTCNLAAMRQVLVNALADIHDSATDDEAVGLSIDMLDVDRLREWARNIEAHGADLTQWASLPFLVKRLTTLADNIDTAVRDIGTLRAKVAALPMRVERLGGQRTQYLQRDSVLAILEAQEGEGER